jgi:hypothetical protein
MEKIINNCINNKNSLKQLLFEDISKYIPVQSFSIRFGIVMEKAIRKFFNSCFINVEPIFRKKLTKFFGREVQLDIANVVNDTIVCGELKYNWNLDTEKFKGVIDKINMLNNFFSSLKREENFSIVVVSLLYPKADQIPELKNAFVSGSILGYNEFFDIFGINVTEEMWLDLHSMLGKYIMSFYNQYIERKYGNK